MNTIPCAQKIPLKLSLQEWIIYKHLEVDVYYSSLIEFIFIVLVSIKYIIGFWCSVPWFIAYVQHLMSNNLTEVPINSGRKIFKNLSTFPIALAIWNYYYFFFSTIYINYILHLQNIRKCYITVIVGIIFLFLILIKMALIIENDV